MCLVFRVCVSLFVCENVIKSAERERGRNNIIIFTLFVIYCCSENQQLLVIQFSLLIKYI